MTVNDIFNLKDQINNNFCCKINTETITYELNLFRCGLNLPHTGNLYIIFSFMLQPKYNLLIHTLMALSS